MATIDGEVSVKENFRCCETDSLVDRNCKLLISCTDFMDGPLGTILAGVGPSSYARKQLLPLLGPSTSK